MHDCRRLPHGHCVLRRFDHADDAAKLSGTVGVWREQSPNLHDERRVSRGQSGLPAARVGYDRSDDLQRVQFLELRRDESGVLCDGECTGRRMRGVMFDGYVAALHHKNGLPDGNDVLCWRNHAA